MYNDILTIGKFTIHGYGLMIGIGVLVALLVGEKRAKNRDMDGEFVYPLVALTVVFGFLAARILFIITEFKGFLKNPMAYLTGAGFVVYGGIIGGIITIFVVCRIKKYNAVDYLDLLAPSVALAQGFGRIGCLLAGCCYGRETECSLGIVFTHSDFAPNGVRLIPTQIIMSVGDFIIAAVLLLYAKNKKIRGQVIILYLIMYSIGRFAVEFLRNDYRGNVGILSTSQFIGIIVAAIAIVIYYLIVRNGKESKSDL